MSQGSSGKLADTTFNTSPDDKLAVIDVYENESAGVENSFQDEYHKGDSGDSLPDTGQSPLDSITDGFKQGNDLLDSVKDKANDFNKVLDGLKNGNLDSLNSLTGNSFSGIKQISDAVNQATRAANTVVGQATSAINAVTSIGNTLKSGLNAKSVLNRLANNNSLVKQVKDVIRKVGTIDSNIASLESSMGRASKLLGGDKSSQNTAIYGTRNKARDLEVPKPYDLPVSAAQTKVLVDKLKNINPTVGSAISELPPATQAALVRGFNSEVNKGLIVGDSKKAMQLSPEASKAVIVPLQKIIGTFTPETTQKTVVQDTHAVATLISGVSHIASKAGFKDTFSQITKNVTNKNVILSAAKPLITRAVDEGDMDTIVDLSKSSVYKEIKKVAPDIVRKTCYGAARPEGLGQQGFSSYYKKIKTAFDKIEPDWSTYRLSPTSTLINGACVSSNAFICDLIEATLNERKNSKLTGSNGQNVNDVLNGITSLGTSEDSIHDNTFTDSIENAVDQLNKEAFQKFQETGKGIIALPKDKEVPPTDEVEVPHVLTYDHEKFLLLASVFIDNSVPSEIERHFPFLHLRFEAMGTYNR